jgi:hypothetical protein
MVFPVSVAVDAVDDAGPHWSRMDNRRGQDRHKKSMPTVHRLPLFAKCEVTRIVNRRVLPQAEF